MDQGTLPQGGAAWHTERGDLGIWQPAADVLVAALSGHGEAAFAAPILEVYGKLTPKAPIHVFFDVDGLSNYDTPLRTELTQRFAPDRKRFATFRVLVQSRIVAMGVSVANLTLSGIVSATADRSEFKASLDACLFKRRVTGFSSGVLDVFLRRTTS